MKKNALKAGEGYRKTANHFQVAITSLCHGSKKELLK